LIFTLRSNEIAAHWHLIESFLVRDEWKPEEIRNALELAKAQLWALAEDGRIRGIVITEHTDRVGTIWIASGKGLDGEAMQLLSDIENWLRAKGCTEVRIEGRRGWGRVLSGYEEKATVFVKRL
jgi:hypothetical protein